MRSRLRLPRGFLDPEYAAVHLALEEVLRRPLGERVDLEVVSGKAKMRSHCLRWHVKREGSKSQTCGRKSPRPSPINASMR